MKQTSVKVINKWIEDHAPGGLSKLQIASGVSVTTIHYCRHGQAPVKEATRNKLRKYLKIEGEL